MAKLFPELVFTRGPQRGQRVPLSKTMNVVGRDPACDVALADEYASRQHARIIVEGSRVRMVNTSPNGTKVNGRLVEQAELSSGDLIGFGLECEVRVETAPVRAPAPTGALPTRAAPAAPGARPEPQPAEKEAEEAPAKRKFKKPTTIAWVGIYLAVLFGLFTLIKLLTGGAEQDLGHGPRAFSDEEIRAHISAPLKAAKNDRLAADALDKATRGYETWETGIIAHEHLYGTLKQFKLALGHYQKEDFGTTIHRMQGGQVKLVQTMMDEIEEALFDEVRAIYKNAYRDQRARRWRRARDGYHLLQKVIPDPQDPIYKNTLEHLNVVNAALVKQKSRSGPKYW